MWGISYIIVAIVAPWISDMPNIVYAFLGAWILLSLALSHFVHDKLLMIVQGMFFIQGCLMVYGGVTSWTGLTVWNIPEGNIELFQVSMAFADMLGAVFLFVLAITEKVN